MFGLLSRVRSGFLFTWGGGTVGELGDGTVVDRYSSPVQIGAKSWKVVASTARWPSVGTFASCYAIRSDGALFAWGANGVGQLGLGDLVTRSSPVQVGSSSWTMVAAAGAAQTGTHAIAIRIDGALFAWGLNTSGQLGLGDLTNRSSPVQVGSSSWSFVAGGSANSFAIRIDGALFAWGINSLGCLGLGDTATRSSPVQIGASSWTFVTSGVSSSAAIRADGGLFTWGNGTSGQTGTGTASSRSSPVQVGSSSWTMVASLGVSMVGIRVDGLLFGWGSNGESIWGRDSFTSSNSSPVQIGSKTWKKISASADSNGTGSVCAIDDNDIAYFWGGNVGKIHGISPTASGAVGSRIMAPYRALIPTLTPVSQGSTSWVAISASGLGWEDHHVSAAIRSDGALFMWGENYRHQLGLGLETHIHVDSPTQVGANSWSMVSVGANHVLAIRSDGGLFSWGSGTVNNPGGFAQSTSNGALGHGDILDRSVPTQIGSSSWTFVSAGYGTSFAIRIDGALFAWGGNPGGQLGLGDTTNRSSPVQVGASSWTFVAAGTFATAAIRVGGALFTWGENLQGTLGLGDTTNRSSPVQVGASSWTMVSGGDRFFAAIRVGGSLFTWGSLSNGQSGTGSTLLKSSPTQVGASNWTSVTAGGGWCLGVRADGALFSWGANSAGQLGTGGYTVTSSPVQVGTDTDWANVVAGGFSSTVGFTLGLKTNSMLHVWGANIAGELGISRPSVRRWDRIELGSADLGIMNAVGITKA